MVPEVDLADEMKTNKQAKTITSEPHPGQPLFFSCPSSIILSFTGKYKRAWTMEKKNIDWQQRRCSVALNIISTHVHTPYTHTYTAINTKANGWDWCTLHPYTPTRLYLSVGGCFRLLGLPLVFRFIWCHLDQNLGGEKLINRLWATPVIRNPCLWPIICLSTNTETFYPISYGRVDIFYLSNFCLT